MAKKTKRNHRSATTNARSDDAIRFKRLLVPIDFSEHSKRGLRYAVDLARQFHAEIILIYVVEITLYPPDLGFGQVAIHDFEHEMRERGEKELAQLVEMMVPTDVPSRTLIRTGKPFVEILNAAREERADLIVIPTHGHTGVEHILFGSTAEKVVRKAPCPVFVVRPA
jgi:nucleotide-binding universal stress UspA family protein